MSIHKATPALAAALLFGASTPFAKLLTGDVPPLLLAGLLYLGSGLGLALLLFVRRVKERVRKQPVSELHIPKGELPWLIGAIIAGGMLGPVLLMFGLMQASGANASLLLNVEGVLTALIAWFVFKENADRHIIAGMVVIVLGGVLLSWQPGALAMSPGTLLIIGACFCWAIDNNLTRKVSTNDAMLVACLKGLLAGACNTALAIYSGFALPDVHVIAASLVVGFFGYGLSLTLFVVALRTLGTARTGAYFSVAPLFGVIISWSIWPAVPDAVFWVAALLMAAGIWLHIKERHVHAHQHDLQVHRHKHRHDAHHQHIHDFAWDGQEPHSHEHEHAPMNHTHAHYPDIHHRHLHPH